MAVILGETLDDVVADNIIAEFTGEKVPTPYFRGKIIGGDVDWWQPKIGEDACIVFKPIT